MLLFNQNPERWPIVVHNPYCCSVVTVNGMNSVQRLTLGNSSGGRDLEATIFFGDLLSRRPEYIV